MKMGTPTTQTSSCCRQRNILVIAILCLWVYQFLSYQNYLVRSSNFSSPDLHPFFQSPSVLKSEQSLPEDRTDEDGGTKIEIISQQHTSRRSNGPLPGLSTNDRYIMQKGRLSNGTVIYKPNIMEAVVQSRGNGGHYRYKNTNVMRKFLHTIPYRSPPPNVEEQLMFLRITKTASTTAIQFLYNHHAFHKPKKPFLFPYPLLFDFQRISDENKGFSLTPLVCMYTTSSTPYKQFQQKLQQSRNGKLILKLFPNERMDYQNEDGPIKRLQTEDPFFKMRNMYHSPDYQCPHVDYPRILAMWAYSLLYLGNEEESSQSYSLQAFTVLRDPTTRFPSFFRYLRAIYPGWESMLSPDQKKLMLEGNLTEFTRIPQSQFKSQHYVFQNAALHHNYEKAKGLISGPSPKVLPLLQECLDVSFKLLMVHFPHFFFEDHRFIDKHTLRSRIDAIVTNFTMSEKAKSKHRGKQTRFARPSLRLQNASFILQVYHAHIVPISISLLTVDQREQIRIRKFPEMKPMPPNQTLTREQIEEWHPEEFEIYELAKIHFRDHLMRYKDMFTKEELETCYNNLGH
jgi:hypothetical protein